MRRCLYAKVDPIVLWDHHQGIRFLSLLLRNLIIPLMRMVPLLSEKDRGVLILLAYKIIILAYIYRPLKFNQTLTKKENSIWFQIFTNKSDRFLSHNVIEIFPRNLSAIWSCSLQHLLQLTCIHSLTKFLSNTSYIIRVYGPSTIVIKKIENTIDASLD